MWVLLAILSAFLLGVYDVFKKKSLVGNNVLTVLFLNTLFSALFLLPVIIKNVIAEPILIGEDALYSHAKILLKSFIVLSSWVLGYFGVKHLPLTVTGPISATRPVLVLIGALLIYGEQLNAYQWIGVSLAFLSLLFVNMIGRKDGVSFTSNKWIWFCLGATVMGAVSALYDKELLLQYEPLYVQSWYSLYQCFIMGTTIFILKRTNKDHVKFEWRWSIPAIALFLTLADIAYFYALSVDGAMISIISMTRRGSVIVPFLYGLLVLKEDNAKLKILDLILLFIGLIFLIIGSRIA
jgi:bacterial/archaeal transporter family protein